MKYLLSCGACYTIIRKGGCKGLEKKKEKKTASVEAAALQMERNMKSGIIT
jgi:hypothetical protein